MKKREMSYEDYGMTIEEVKFHMMKAERVIEELKNTGYKDAAKFLETKLD